MGQGKAQLWGAGFAGSTPILCKGSARRESAMPKTQLLSFVLPIRSLPLGKDDFLRTNLSPTQENICTAGLIRASHGEKNRPLRCASRKDTRQADSRFLSFPPLPCRGGVGGRGSNVLGRPRNVNAKSGDLDFAEKCCIFA